MGKCITKASEKVGSYSCCYCFRAGSNLFMKS